MASRQQINAIESTIDIKTPYRTGTVSVSPHTYVLYYGREAALGRIDLANATVPELEKLAASCTKATFGVNQKDVLDESYRKARKLDVTDFALNFDVGGSGIIELVRNQLLEGASKGIKAELYKLNVYDQGSFFKAHKDTPRGAQMFGSLVLVLPTPHEGGALTLRHKGEEWTLDHAKVLAEHAEPVIAYTAFFSDVEHEVALVTSGHRVTITYNLYFTDAPALNTFLGRSIREDKFHAQFSALLVDKTFFPKGGLLAFGLSHEYPIKGSSLEGVEQHLKGSDAAIYHLLEELSLSPRLKMFYFAKYDDEWNVMTSEVLDEIEGNYEEGVMARIIEDSDAEYFRGPEDGPDDRDCIPACDVPKVYWVHKTRRKNSQKKVNYIAYGNEAEMDSMYGSPSLIATIGPYGSR